MADRQQARQVSRGLPSCALLAASLAGLYGADAAALPRVAPASLAPPGVILIQSGGGQLPEAAAGTSSGQQQTPFTELNEALAAARARLEELSKAAAAAATVGQARQQLEAASQENQRLQSELATMRASRDQLRAASEDTAARFAELTATAGDAAAEAKRIEEELVKMRWQNTQLNTSLRAPARSRSRPRTTDARRRRR